MRRLLTVLAIVGSLVLLNTHTWSHHAFSSEFDIDKPISLRGTITRMEWVNPHTWLHMTATIEDDTIQEWMLEGGTPNTLLRAGLTQQILLPGTEILVRGYQSKDPDCIPKCRGSGRDITFTDGSNIFMGSSGVGAPPEGFPDDNDE
ncbi:MAG: hypothetical protein CMQ32_09880 [Gammaproteobacteria bacterium]|nr:hypothetical protein [Gammaproteobacteria bacterium]MBE48120.1 hypothetical protein [Gammaproteobacteria bacterium]MCH2345712.1 DUF6152 family protein [Pseudomonadales bacterium]MEE2608273.1 DUF6152 family protein [Pseudomonadota bacterium]HAD71003.1 hypothetical protein [Gammaproteobacteria bacterium]